MPGDANDEDAKEQRRDDDLDKPEKNRAEELQVDCDRGPVMAKLCSSERPTKIQVVSERREVAKAAMRTIATQRRNAVASSGNATICALASSDAEIAIVAAAIAAASNLFFIGSRQSNSSVPKGILVGRACQSWRVRLESAPVSSEAE